MVDHNALRSLWVWFVTTLRRLMRREKLTA